MKAQLKVGPKLIIEVDGQTDTDLFAGLARAQEVFEHEKCGKCNSTDLRFVVREVDGNKYYELHCRNLQCRARLAFGQAKEPKGELYPKRKFTSLGKNEQKQRVKEKEYADKHFGYLEHNGWHKWEGDPEKEQS